MHGDVFEVGVEDGMHSLDQSGAHGSVAVGACGVSVGGGRSD